jgi:hypothetical protein
MSRRILKKPAVLDVPNQKIESQQGFRPSSPPKSRLSFRKVATPLVKSRPKTPHLAADFVATPKKAAEIKQRHTPINASINNRRPDVQKVPKRAEINVSPETNSAKGLSTKVPFKIFTRSNSKIPEPPKLKAKNAIEVGMTKERPKALQKYDQIGLKARYESILSRKHASEASLQETLNELKRLIIGYGLPLETVEESHQRINRSIEPTLRGKIWAILLNVRRMVPDVYFHYVSKSFCKVHSKIDNDAHRTMPTDENFVKRVNIKELSRILSSFVWYSEGKGDFD